MTKAFFESPRRHLPWENKEEPLIEKLYFLKAKLP